MSDIDTTTENIGFSTNEFLAILGEAKFRKGSYLNYSMFSDLCTRGVFWATMRKLARANMVSAETVPLEHGEYRRFKVLTAISLRSVSKKFKKLREYIAV